MSARWDRKALSYGAPYQPWLPGRDHEWVLSLAPREGIAFGFEIDGKTIWAQSAGDNYHFPQLS